MSPGFTRADRVGPAPNSRGPKAPTRSDGLVASFLVPLGLYAGLFAILAVRWLRVATHATPASDVTLPVDERVVVWILGWVAHALTTDPARLMDANVNYPAPGQLSGIEHFLSAQLAFAPLFSATHNAVLSANVTVLLSYPLAAASMYWLLGVLGCGRPASAVGGLLFALGPLRVPANLMLLKHSNFYFPLVAVALTRLRERPTLARACALAAITSVAALSSYYLAAMVAVVALLWWIRELGREPGSKLRFTVLSACSAAAALASMLPGSLAYFTRPEAAYPPGDAAQLAAIHVIIGHHYLKTVGWLSAGLAAVGLVAIAESSAVPRRLAWTGIFVTFVGLVLMCGPVVTIGGRTIPLPFLLLQHSPARFFRAPSRFVVVVGFGMALLAAAGFESVNRRVGARAGLAAAFFAAAALIATRGIYLSGTEFTQFPEQTQAIYRTVHAVAQTEGEGPLLELPFVSVAVSLAGGSVPPESKAMVASTRHWLPLVTGLVGYPPPHRELVLETIRRLPDTDALNDLVDMTHLRWILLLPESEWPQQQRRVRVGLRGMAGLHPVAHVAGWDLLRVDRRPRNAAWFNAIAAGWQPGQTVLGTPLRPLTDDDARARVTSSTPPSAVTAGQPMFVIVRITNVGHATWPVALAPESGQEYAVRGLARWWPREGPRRTAAEAEHEFDLSRDVPPGDSVNRVVWMTAPADPGPRELEITVRQISGAPFDGPGNLPLRVGIEVQRRVTTESRG